MAEARVALVRCTDYGREKVEGAVGEVLDLLGGMGSFVRPGARVLLKPNLLSAWEPECAVTTHPEMVRAVARAAQGAGGRVSLGDSPGVGTLSAVLARSGVGAVAEELGLAVSPFAETAAAERPAGARFRRLFLARAALEADAVINLPKVKTHQQMVLSLAVKNLFGCVVGKEKAAWHLNAGTDAGSFARMLVEVCCAVRPVLSVADGVVGMEGPGPTHGDVRAFGFVAGSADAFALDAVLAHVLGFGPEEVPLFGAAREARSDGLPVGETELARIEVLGCGVDEVRVRGLRRPAGGRLMFVPGFAGWALRRLVTVRPEIVAEKCEGCGVCAESCPAGALKKVDGRLRIDDTACVRCFCCQELCPRGAVVVRRGWLSRFLSR